MLDQILQVGFFAAILRIATPLLLATLGEMLCERSGVLNLGIEGIMLIAAMTRVHGGLFLGQPLARRRRRARDRRRARAPPRPVHRRPRAQPARRRHRPDAVRLGPGLSTSTVSSSASRSVPPSITGFRDRADPASSPTSRSSGRSSSTSLRWSISRIAAVPVICLPPLPHALGPRSADVRREPASRRFGRHQRRLHALAGADARRRADGRRRRVSLDGAVQRLHLRRRSRDAAGSPSRSSCSVAGTRGAARARLSSSPASTRSSCACRRRGLGHIPYQLFLILPFVLTIVAMAVMSRDAVAPAALLSRSGARSARPRVAGRITADRSCGVDDSMTTIGVAHRLRRRSMKLSLSLRCFRLQRWLCCRPLLFWSITQITLRRTAQPRSTTSH